MAVTPKSRKKLDKALENFQQIVYAVSISVKKALSNLQQFNEEALTVRELSDFSRAVNQLIQALKVLIEIAPFFEAKKHIEGTEGLILWLSMSSDVIGEERQRMIEVIKDYQLAILKDADTTGLLEREQFQLL